jgi:hypothetical protein
MPMPIRAMLVPQCKEMHFNSSRGSQIVPNFRLKMTGQAPKNAVLSCIGTLLTQHSPCPLAKATRPLRRTASAEAVHLLAMVTAVGTKLGARRRYDHPFDVSNVLAGCRRRQPRSRAGSTSGHAVPQARATDEWSGPAERGEAAARFNLGQEGKLGRGAPVGPTKAEDLVNMAPAQGYLQVSDSYALLQFLPGTRTMPLVSSAADPRAASHPVVVSATCLPCHAKPSQALPRRNRFPLVDMRDKGKHP